MDATTVQSWTRSVGSVRWDYQHVETVADQALMRVVSGCGTAVAHRHAMFSVANWWKGVTALKTLLRADKRRSADTW